MGAIPWLDRALAPEELPELVPDDDRDMEVPPLMGWLFATWDRCWL